MNKLIALMLLFAVPAFAQQKTTLVPAFDHADVAKVDPAATDIEPPLYTRWYVWALTGTATVAVVAAVVLVAATAFRSNQVPFGSCGPGPVVCDSSVGAPPTR